MYYRPKAHALPNTLLLFNTISSNTVILETEEIFLFRCVFPLIIL